ncbi:hypothetical protein BVRB_3g049240 [Beta vulgaris subsp. vulgaris]|uniref:uncharacterized protein LOC104888081 n=1 Tax=Beta vulgaris subsp. vulgaris TaxID=3555 RepID=UPI00054004FE|nr:uncharacterized protein LOC104888081 [Beta vulgaris subsp. vulgaris]KMT16638.1 hypothetical protein BVRB_3g049240 [Beta vulgaris subsp. vulgaris]
MAPGLLGPPELHSSTISTTASPPSIHPSDQLKPPSSLSSSSSSSSSYFSTGNPCLDFFHVTQQTTSSELIQRLQFSWQHSPLTTLKLICNLRAVRGTGKNDKEGFYTSALWLHKNHPKTLACNVGYIARFGSLKDLLEILFRILEGSDVRYRMKREWETMKPAFFAQRCTKKVAGVDDLKKAKVIKLEKKANKAKKAIDRYNHDPEYKFLYDCVCDVFAHLLKKDMELLRVNDVDNVSLAAKWCPSLDSSYDEYLLICEKIARKLFPRDECKEYDGVEENHYAYRVRTRLRKEVLVPLRRELDLPEVYMCAKRWRDIPYDRVASKAMYVGKKVFLKRDRDGFEEYLEDVEEGELTICAGALLPNEIVSSLYDSDKELNLVSELQWKRMLDDLGKNNGELVNCSAMANNISGDVCVGFMILVSELSCEPWKGKVITWGEDPELYHIEGEKLVEKVESVQHMMCDSKVDLQKVFDQILKFTLEENLTEDQMLRRFFVFIDEEFDKVCVHPWEMEYADIQRKFRDRGIQKVPELVVWNLKGSLGVPVKCDQPGMAVVSGLSKNLLTLFLDDCGVLTPESVMNAAISRPEYDQLVVHD